MSQSDEKFTFTSAILKIKGETRKDNKAEK